MPVQHNHGKGPAHHTALWACRTRTLLQSRQHGFPRRRTPHAVRHPRPPPQKGKGRWHKTGAFHWPGSPRGRCPFGHSGSTRQASKVGAHPALSLQDQPQRGGTSGKRRQSPTHRQCALRINSHHSSRNSALHQIYQRQLRPSSQLKLRLPPCLSGIHTPQGEPRHPWRTNLCARTAGVYSALPALCHRLSAGSSVPLCLSFTCGPWPRCAHGPRCSRRVPHHNSTRASAPPWAWMAGVYSALLALSVTDLQSQVPSLRFPESQPAMILLQVHLQQPCYDFCFL